MARRRDLNVILPGVQTLLVVGLDYAHTHDLDALLADPARGRIAAYAWGLDYHDVMSARLEQLAAWLQRESRQSSVDRVYVDTGAILERSHAQQAGLGFFGKNTMLIHPRRGSHFFIGEILTSLEVDDHDSPQTGVGCGTCTRCLDVCPTDAFPRPFVLDARRCISYLTIEHRGWIKRGSACADRRLDLRLRPLPGRLPLPAFQRPRGRAGPARHQPDAERIAPLLTDLLAMDEREFLRRWRGTPLQRTGHTLLLRNACLAAANGAVMEAIPALTHLLEASSPLLRGHAAWALARLDADLARPALRARHAREDDDEARREIELALFGA